MDFVNKPRVPLDTGASVNVRKPENATRPVLYETGTEVVGFACPKPDRYNTDNISAGASYRFLRRAPATMERARARWLKYKVAEFCRVFLVPLTHEEVSVDLWLKENKSYTMKRKEVLRKLGKTMDPLKPRTDVESFGKNESYAEFKHLRLINSRHDEFKVMFGPFTHAMEKQVFGLRQFVKHVPTKDRIRYANDALTKLYTTITDDDHEKGLSDEVDQGLDYYVTDHSSFEAHMTETVMKACELVVYKYMMKGFPEEFKVVRRALSGVNRCSTRNVSMKRRAGRMSGDMCTSLGNGLTNLLVAEAILDGTPHAMIVEGDDGLISVPHGTVLRSESWRRFGFDIKIERVESPAFSGFCGAQSLTKRKQEFPVADPRVAIAGCTWLDDRPGNDWQRLALLRAKALSLYFELGRGPILGSFCRYILRATKGVPALYKRDWYSVYQLKTLGLDYQDSKLGLTVHTTAKLDIVDIPDDIRAEYWRRYGVLPSVQLALEKHFDSLKTLERLDCPAIHQLFYGAPLMCDALDFCNSSDMRTYYEACYV